MELLCIQSQEHDKLPLAELNAVIECEDMELDISKITEGLILSDTCKKIRIHP